jgi:hypothetical protein
MNEPETRVTTESEPEPVDLSVDLTIEHGRVCVIRGVARADIWHRPRDEGPFGAGRECSGVGIARAELLDELIRACQVRTYRVHGMAVGGRRGSWGPLVIGCLPGDLDSRARGAAGAVRGRRRDAAAGLGRPAARAAGRGGRPALGAADAA